MDYSEILDVVGGGLIAAEFIALAAIKIGPNVAAWASHKLAIFFDEDYRWDYEENEYWEKRGGK